MSRIAALLTRMSRRPNRLSASLTVAAICSSFVMSRAWPKTSLSGPVAVAAPIASAPSMSPITTLAPSAAKRVEIARPIPRAPPVISAALPWSRLSLAMPHPQRAAPILCCTDRAAITATAREPALVGAYPGDGGSEDRPLLRGLLEIRQQIGDILLLLEPREKHLVARHHRLRIGDVLCDRLLGPDDSRFLHGARVREALDAAGRPAEDAEQIRPHPVLLLVEHVAGLAPAEDLFAGGRVTLLGEHRTAGKGHKGRAQHDLQSSRHRYASLIVRPSSGRHVRTSLRRRRPRNQTEVPSAVHPRSLRTGRSGRCRAAATA